MADSITAVIDADQTEEVREKELGPALEQELGLSHFDSDIGTN